MHTHPPPLPHPELFTQRADIIPCTGAKKRTCLLSFIRPDDAFRREEEEELLSPFQLEGKTSRSGPISSKAKWLNQAPLTRQQPFSLTRAFLISARPHTPAECLVPSGVSASCPLLPPPHSKPQASRSWFTSPHFPYCGPTRSPVFKISWTRTVPCTPFCTLLSARPGKFIFCEHHSETAPCSEHSITPMTCRTESSSPGPVAGAPSLTVPAARPPAPA